MENRYVQLIFYFFRRNALGTRVEFAIKVGYFRKVEVYEAYYAQIVVFSFFN